ncbi:hypothetical protein GALL_550510 [mine drainage metagenome]|uniref:Uncharacterized protein n=1 Tax=mine drainage metagenome TaxID=410659 RepID=A0A1J5P6I7_9ZZZZ
MDHARLGGRIGDRAEAGLQAGDRGGVDDGSAAALKHQRHGVLHAQSRAAHQDVENPVPAIGGDLGDGPHAVRDAGVVEQDVESAERGLGHGHGRGDLGFLGHVAVGIADLVGEAFFQHRPFLVLDIRGDDAGALGHEQFHRPQADPRYAAGDDRDLAVQTSRHVVSSRPRFSGYR